MLFLTTGRLGPVMELFRLVSRRDVKDTFGIFNGSYIGESIKI